VIAPNAMTSDGTDNAMCVLGVERGMAALKRFENVKARFVELSAEGTVRAVKTAGLP
jgi:thiamine biosynthesis lipoprotein ApbE